MAPEVLFASNHSFQVDFFALGVIIFEFMNGYRPYLGRNRKEIKEAVLAKQIHVHRKQLFENGWTLESGDLINKLLYRKPNKRLGCNGIKDIKEHAWFKNINWDELFEKKMKSPFIPKDGDNFDKRYCEGVEQIDTQTKERYQYYRSKSRFKTLFINYTFVREKDKQEYINIYNKNNNNKITKNNNNNFIIKHNNLKNKYKNNIKSQNVSNERKKHLKIKSMKLNEINTLKNKKRKNLALNTINNSNFNRRHFKLLSYQTTPSSIEKSKNRNDSKQKESIEKKIKKISYGSFLKIFKTLNN